jgi:hypothetical protein
VSWFDTFLGLVAFDWWKDRERRIRQAKIRDIQDEWASGVSRVIADSDRSILDLWMRWMEDVDDVVAGDDVRRLGVEYQAQLEGRHSRYTEALDEWARKSLPLLRDKEHIFAADVSMPYLLSTSAGITADGEEFVARWRASTLAAIRSWSGWCEAAITAPETEIDIVDDPVALWKEAWGDWSRVLKHLTGALKATRASSID